MKKTLSLLLAACMAVNFLAAQSVNDGIKFINYQRYKSAKETLKKLYDANSKDANTIYWYGQALLGNKELPAAKALYQKALQDGVNDAWIWVGMGHVEVLEGGDINAAKQKFEQAVTATIETKGKNKGKGNPAILDAIGRANADGGSKVGDPTYGIDKLKQAAEQEKLAADLYADIYINMGKSYHKLGGEYGGEAVKAYQEAIARDPKNPVAPYLIGRIYASQNNKEQFDQFFNNAIAADPAFPPVYIAYYNYYANKDVNAAKDYIEKYRQYADKDCATDFFYADFLFRSGKYNESLGEAQRMDNGECKSYPGINILYAYNYDRLNDSIKAKTYIEKYFTVASPDLIDPADYNLAVKIFSRFPGSETQTAAFLQRAIDNDTSTVNKLQYMDQAAKMFEKAKLYPQQFEWLQKYYTLKGGTPSEYDYYRLTAAAYNANNIEQTLSISKNYLLAFSDKPQPLIYFRRAAIASDPDSTTGAAVPHLEFLDSFLYAKDSVKFKPDVFKNLYYLLVYYGEKAKDLPKAIEICNRMLEIYPNAGEENAFATNTKKALEAALKKSQGTQKSSSSASDKPSSGSSSSGTKKTGI